ncbi:hypothetical protein GCM10009118_28760 [Wandonia haliotis]|uniref:Amidohydrolase-related domain-containing protein n=1 Tax=Wandonia haliotis TaxID=574963 RepID=A0ABP3Y4Q4_9FLAO
MYTEEQNRFIVEAKASISKEPKSRLLEPAKNVIESDNFVCDAHCHIFDGHCVDGTYFLVRLLDTQNKRFLRRVIRWIVRKVLPGGDYEKGFNLRNHDLSKDEALELIYKQNRKFDITDADLNELFAELDQELKQMDSSEKEIMDFDFRGVVRRIKRVRNMLNQGEMKYVYQQFLIDAVTQTRIHEDKDLLTIVLGMDLESGWEGSNIKPYKKQLDELLELSKEEPIIPFFPIHPKRVELKKDVDGNPYKYNELYDLFLEYFKDNQDGYFGVKLYPALGYYPAHDTLAPIYEVCQACNIPITVHCGGEMISTFKKRIETNIFGKPVTVATGKRKLNARELNDPDNWFVVMEKYENLKVNLAHFGGSGAWEKSRDNLHQRIQDIILLMEKYKGIYSDFSYNFNDDEATRIFSNYMRSDAKKYSKIKERTMYGTDYWVVLPQSNMISDQEYFLDTLYEYNDVLLVDNVKSFLFDKTN